MINNECIEYFFIDINIAHKICEVLNIAFVKLNKSREVKDYDERKDKDITHVIYSQMTIQNHTKNCISKMIIKLNQHSIILEKSWMKKHKVSYHEYDNSILFRLEFCSHLRASNRLFSDHSSQKAKKEFFFSKEELFDQSDVDIQDIENKELLIFLEKTNSKTILKRSTSNQAIELVVKRLNKRSNKFIKLSKRSNERRRIDEFWRKKLSKIETSLFRIILKKSRKKSFSFFDEKNEISKIDLMKTNNLIEIHSIATASFNTLCRQKNVEIFAVFMKNLNIQLKKQESSVVIDIKSVISIEYHDFLNVFSTEKIDVLSSHRKHDHWIELKEEKTHEYASLYNMSEDELLLIKKYLQEHLNKNFIESSIASYAFLILFAKKLDEDLRFCVNDRKLNVIIKKNMSDLIDWWKNELLTAVCLI
jgi:hypothetical protein